MRCEVLVKVLRCTQADCTKALVLDAGMCKAYVRRSTARQNLKKFEEALADARAARKLEPGNKELKRIQRAVEAAQLEHEYDQASTTRRFDESGDERARRRFPARVCFSPWRLFYSPRALVRCVGTRCASMLDTRTNTPKK